MDEKSLRDKKTNRKSGRIVKRSLFKTSMKFSINLENTSFQTNGIKPINHDIISPSWHFPAQS